MQATVRKYEILPGRSIDDFLSLQHENWNASTTKMYKKYLYELCDYMAEHGPATPQTYHEWQQHLYEKGYQDRSINLRIVAANHYFRWCGNYDWAIPLTRIAPSDNTPELSRNEYLRLLRAARQLGRRRDYLLVKLFATTGLPVQCLNQVTVESVQASSSKYSFRGECHRFNLPDVLRCELLDYIHETGITSGPVFITSTGTALDRVRAHYILKDLCAEAKIAPEKGSVRTLQKLYRTTQFQLMAWAKAFCWQTFNNILASEQAVAGWTG